MLKTLAISNYRSLFDVVVPLAPLNVVAGANGTGKSNLYRALRLLADTAQAGVVGALALEGGLPSAFWAGPERVGNDPLRHREVEGGPRNLVKRLHLGFASEDFGYAISLGHPPHEQGPGKPPPSAFFLDPEIKREWIWHGDTYHPTAAVLDRKAGSVKVRPDRKWEVQSGLIEMEQSVLASHLVPSSIPALNELRSSVRQWRFYDHFRSDREAPARQSRIGTRTPILHQDGRDLGAALQTIIEVGDHQALQKSIADAFPECELKVAVDGDSRFSILFSQSGLLRPFSVSELSEGTLLYLLWIAALLTPRPPPLMVLNEPEASLHTDLLPALGRLIGEASKTTQVWVITHSLVLAQELKKHSVCQSIHLEKHYGQTLVRGQKLLEQPIWRWPDAR